MAPAYPERARRRGQQCDRGREQVGSSLDEHLESKCLLVDGAGEEQLRPAAAQGEDRSESRPSPRSPRPAIRMDEISARDRPSTRRLASSRLRVASAMRALL